jgi:ribosomal protein S18 acetylase RimI-like enzyme
VDAGSDADAALVLEIHRQVLAEGDYFITEADEFRQTRAWKAAAIRDLVGSKNSCFLVGRLDGQLVGALIAQGGHLRRSRHVARLEIFVGQAARGRGVGRALMDAAIGWARDNAEVEKLALTVFADNDRAIQLYDTVGFVVEGRRGQEYRLGDGTYRDDLLMGLWLGPA